MGRACRAFYPPAVPQPPHASLLLHVFLLLQARFPRRVGVNTTK